MDKNTDKNKTDTASNENILHDFQPSNTASIFTRTLFIFLITALLLGVGTGYLLSPKGIKKTSTTAPNGSVSSFDKGTVIGSEDTKTFKDTTEGILQNGGIEDEGQFHLVRPGGDSQNVYLTSSIVDLSKFTGKKVKVWGQTQKAQKAGWLMDVGRVEVLE